MLEIQNIRVQIEKKSIIEDVSITIGENDFYMVIGPNGAGKSTLIKAIMQIYSYEGQILLEGRDVSGIKPKTLAKCIGVLSQSHEPQFSHTVYEVISLGRYAHQQSLFGILTREDKSKIEEALTLTGMQSLASRSILTLSGGELQRVYLAQLLAQDPRILLLDEPANHLDLKYQITLFDIIKEWSKGKRKAVLAIVHDLNTAFSYGTKAMLMHEGKVYQTGEVSAVLTRENLKAVYTVDVAQWMQSLMRHWG